MKWFKSLVSFSKFNKKEDPFNPRRLFTSSDFKVFVMATENKKDGELVNFNLSLKASKNILNQVEKVVYNIHPSFGKSAVFKAENKKDQFKTGTYISYAHGWETMGTKIFLKDGSVIEMDGSTIPKPKKKTFSKKDFELGIRTLTGRSGLNFVLFLFYEQRIEIH